MSHLLSCNMHIIAWDKNGVGKEALALIYQMKKRGIKHNHSTFTTIFPICVSMETIKHNVEVHKKIIRKGFIMICL